MSRSKTSLSGLFAHILRPVTSSVEAETGRKVTAPQWGRILQKLAAKALRALARLVEPPVWEEGGVSDLERPEPAAAPALIADRLPEQTAHPEPAAPARGGNEVTAAPVVAPARKRKPARETRPAAKGKTVPAAARVTKPANAPSRSAKAATKGKRARAATGAK